ncbi:M20/M25/M40 family metallo-hydrolase [Oceanobacillus halotolerans]|uniref:M20/M25/M40 family metallo-hydrolase n=1 Tax=Oceanobacillus halotolerans TaxID=2663380 RepID=UPI0013DCED2D|nr:M20/M25/M40 family metallo-hydrolase [Oceanobacillus halotolerans]
MSHLACDIQKNVLKNKEKFINDLFDFLKIKSISAQNKEMESCANFLKDFMIRQGVQSKILNIDGALPVVYGEVLNSNANKTILIYGHYDVQPEDPIYLWDSDPFDPEIRDNKIYARGATDDKGNLMATILAVKTLLDIKGTVPINIKFFFEGEEEIGSPNLKSYLKKYKDLLESDYTILCDRGIHESGRPQIYLGNKGITHADITVYGAKRDVHSGQAPLIPNPSWELVWLLNKMKDDQDEILVDEYKNEVIEPSEEDLKLLKNIPFDTKEFSDTYGINRIIGNKKNTDGVDLLVRLLYEPTMTINGLSSGYQGEGNKTIIPSRATAKLDFRFVKDMDPAKSVERIKSYISKVFKGNIDIKFGDVRNPSKVSPNESIVQTSIIALTEMYDNGPVVWPLLDGSGPMSLFGEILDAPAIIIGLGSPFSLANTHAPNENIGVDNYLNGIMSMSYIYYLYGEDQ